MGRFLSLDPLADAGGQQVLSPYHAMGCNPVSMVDPLGLRAGMFPETHGAGGPTQMDIALMTPPTILLDRMYGFGNDPWTMMNRGALNDYEVKMAGQQRLIEAVSGLLAVRRYNYHVRLENQRLQEQSQAIVDYLVSLAIKQSRPGYLADGGYPYETNTGWRNLYKADLEYFAKQTGTFFPTNYDLGSLFEKLFELSVMNSSKVNSIRKNRALLTGGDRNTVPDFVGNVAGTYERGSAVVWGAEFFELKAKYGGLYLSSNAYQMRGHIDNASRKFALERRKFTNFQPIVNLITTADVSFSFGIAAHAIENGVTYAHYWAEYRIIDGNWQFRFTTPAKFNMYGK